MDKRDLITRRAEFAGALLHNRHADVSDAEMLDFALKHELGPLVYFCCHDYLPAEKEAFFRKVYLNSSAMDMKFCAAYAEVKRLLDNAQIDYAPLKGAGLVCQKIFPNGALRPRCDIDLLFRSQEDCIRAQKVLSANQWKIAGEIEKYHHLPPLFKGNLMLEMHHLLPGVRRHELTAQLWTDDFTCQPDSCEYWLSAELHWAVLLAHIAINHDWEIGAKFLLDAGVLMNVPGFDKEKCFAYCRRLGITTPENLLSAFPEIFGGAGDVVQYADLRNHVLGGTIPIEALLMNKGRPYSLRWWSKRLNGFRPSWLRQKYNLQDASSGKVLKVMWQDYRRKIRKGFKYMFAADAADERMKNSVNARKQLGIDSENEVYRYI